MKFFRFAWNGEMFDKKETVVILFTIITSVTALTAVVVSLLYHHFSN